MSVNKILSLGSPASSSSATSSTDGGLRRSPSKYFHFLIFSDLVNLFVHVEGDFSRNFTLFFHLTVLSYQKWAFPGLFFSIFSFFLHPNSNDNYIN